DGEGKAVLGDERRRKNSAVTTARALGYRIEPAVIAARGGFAEIMPDGNREEREERGPEEDREDRRAYEQPFASIHSGVDREEEEQAGHDVAQDHRVSDDEPLRQRAAGALPEAV